MADEQQVNGAAPQEQSVQFNIQRIYTKDISFETPNSPAIFVKEWKPEVKLDLDTKTTLVEENLFQIGAMPEGNRAQLLGAFCPNTLFPYAREAISNLVNRGTFPALNLAPVNFDAVFQAYVQKRAAEEQGKTPQADA